MQQNYNIFFGTGTLDPQPMETELYRLFDPAYYSKISDYLPIEGTVIGPALPTRSELQASILQSQDGTIVAQSTDYIGPGDDPAQLVATEYCNSVHVGGELQDYGVYPTPLSTGNNIVVYNSYTDQRIDSSGGLYFETITCYVPPSENRNEVIMINQLYSIYVFIIFLTLITAVDFFIRLYKSGRKPSSF